MKIFQLPTGEKNQQTPVNKRRYFSLWGFLGVFLIGLIGLYLRLVTSSSTEGFFLRVATKDLETAQFFHDTSVFHSSQLEKDLRDKIDVDVAKSWRLLDKKEKSYITTYYLTGN